MKFSVIRMKRSNFIVLVPVLSKYQSLFKTIITYTTVIKEFYEMRCVESLLTFIFHVFPGTKFFSREKKDGTPQLTMDNDVLSG